MQRFFNMFNVIGSLLLVIAALGFVSGGKWIAETGTKPSKETAIVYLGAGLLMLANGYMSHKVSQRSN